MCHRNGPFLSTRLSLMAGSQAVYKLRYWIEKHNPYSDTLHESILIWFRYCQQPGGIQKRRSSVWRIDAGCGLCNMYLRVVLCKPTQIYAFTCRYGSHSLHAIDIFLVLIRIYGCDARIFQCTVKSPRVRGV